MKNNLKKHLIAFSALPALLIGSTAYADQVVQDDQIIVGSQCVGIDCVNGESFNFDTIRLKENNLRIRFIDTSASSSFPSVDWQIAINDSVNGGLNYFAVEDLDSNTTPFRILGSAPNDSLYVAANGNIGAGTSTPLVDMHVKSGNSPTLRLEQDGSSGFASQIWDIAGNETNFFIRDVTNGSALPFRIVPGAPNGALYIAADGDVGLSTTTPDGLFDIASSTDANNHALLVASNDFVGIGISNGSVPQANLDIEASTPDLRLTGTASGQQWEMRMNGAGNLNFLNVIATNTVLSMGPTANDNLLQLGRAANDQVTINGNLVINTGSCTAPNAGGDANCGADYVFEDDYKRLPLSELKEFVTANKHLPNIPKASHMAENGIDLTELSVQLLAKVEELTLYTIDQQEVINTLQDRLITLETAEK